MDSEHLVVLLSAYLDKQNPVFGGFRRRFVVLTHDALHWFKRDEHDHLFGDERGQIKLQAMEVVRILDEDPAVFEIISSNFTNRHFKCASNNECEEWVSALRSAIKSHMMTMRKRSRSKSIYNPDGQKFMTAELAAEEEHQGGGINDPKVILVSLGEPDKREEVIARNPAWGRLIVLNNVTADDELVVSLSNGGSIKLTAAALLDKSTTGFPFQADIKNVPLASSLQILAREAVVPEVSSLMQDKNPGRFADLKLVFLKITGDTATVERVILSLMTITTGISLLPFLLFHTTPNSFCRGLEHALALEHECQSEGECSTTFTHEASAGYMPTFRLDSRSVGVTGEGLYFPINSSLGLFASIAFVLALHSFILVYMNITRNEKLKNVGKGDDYHLYLLEHQFTSPDAPVTAQEDIIPQRFLNGCDQDVREARRRWDITRKWREDEGINDILNEAQPHYKTIKTMYPHYVCSKSNDGVYAYYERPGEIEIAQLAARGIGVNEMLRHWLYCTEFFYTHFAKGELDKCLTVLDLGGMSMSDVKGEPLEFVRKTVSYANQHYPERAHCIYLVNVPGWFSWIYKLLKPLIHENTQKKVKILSKKEVLDGLKEHIDVSQIPAYYGGDLTFGPPNENGVDDTCRFHSVEETYMAKMTDRLNRRLAGEEVSDDEDETTQANTSVADSDRSKSDEGTTSEERPQIEPQISNLSMTSRQDSRETPVKSSSSRGNPLSPRAATNMQMMQMHLQKSVAAGRVQSDDWSVSSIGQNSTSSPGLPPQTRKRKPFSGR